MSESAEEVFRHQYSAQQRNYNRPCRYFAASGWCRFGFNCNFSHDLNYHGGGGGFTSLPENYVSSVDYRWPAAYSQQHYYYSTSRHKVTAADYQSNNNDLPEASGGPVVFQQQNAYRLNESRNYNNGQNWRTTHYHQNYASDQITERELLQRMSAVSLSTNTQRRKPCRYYLDGYCRKGNTCSYLHSRPVDFSRSDDCMTTNVSRDVVENAQFDQPKYDSLEETKESVSEEIQPEYKPESTRIIVQKQIFLLSEITQDKLQELRNVEITQLKKRFLPPNLEELISANVDETTFIVTLTPTDPDWPFDVREVRLNVCFPKDYPKECLNSDVLQSNNESLPETLVKSLSREIQKWFKETHAGTVASGKVELYFRPFLRWIDRNMEELFVNGLKETKRNIDAEAAGLQFVPFDQLLQSRSSSGDTKDEGTVTADGSVQDESVRAATTNKSVKNEQGNRTDGKGTRNEFRAPKRGIEIVLHNLKLGEDVATVACKFLHLTVECRRCATRHDVNADASFLSKKHMSIECTKCHCILQVAFNSSLMHTHSSVMGYLDLDGCLAFDLPIVECGFSVECMNCNTKQYKKGLHYGQPWDLWCRSCNNKMSISVDSAKFRSIQRSSAFDKRSMNFIKVDKKEKKSRDPAIREGRPLPSNGTCRHYKKSFRWFRFPCCGKIYPCDVCHDDQELEHEMKFATRIICGFCAKEQPFSNIKPCIACGSSFSNAGRTHWEGGRGCRDRTKMSREDSHKYSGMGKTISRKAQDLVEKQKKKKTKSS